MYVLWLVLFVVLLVVEALTLQLVTIWFALGSVCSFVAALLGANVTVQSIIFVAVSVLSFIITKPLVKKFLNSKAVPTNVDRYIGQNAIVKETIDNINSKGQVTLENGSVWSAKSADNSVIAENSLVKINSIEGVKVIVSLLDEQTITDNK
ncbi:MAG: NfeD family protein [Clostridiales bacterium]|nr:NfeD family protein [Clostridiales bacterium]